MSQLRALHPDLAEVARIVCHEDESRIAGEIDALRLWLELQPHLKARTDDQFLVAFLRFCKYDLDAAKQRIDFYYTFKSSSPDLLDTWRIDDKMLGIANSGVFATLPAPAGHAGPCIHFTMMGNVNTALYNVKDYFRFHAIRAEIEINTNDNWIISGVLEILDFSRLPYSLLRQYENALFKRMCSYLEYGIPTELKGTHIVNASKEAQLVMTLVRSVMKQKDLLHIHSNLESLQKAIGKDYLPIEYGGTNGSLKEQHAAMERQLLEYQDYFVQDKQYGVIENLRPLPSSPSRMAVAGNSSGNTNTHRVGIFRKIEVD